MESDTPGWYVPAMGVIAFSLYFLSLPLEITILVFFVPWAIYAAFVAIGERMYQRKHGESQLQRYQRWYGDDARQEIFNDTFGSRR